MKLPSLSDPNDRVSRAVKVLVIVLTIVTAIAFGAFFLKFFTKLNGPKAKTEWSEQLPAVGDKLKSAGLKQQAIEQYIKYLEKQKIDLGKRAEVSLTVGKLYKELGNCPDALTWLYQAELAGPSPSKKAEVESLIKACLNHVNSRIP